MKERSANARLLNLKEVLLLAARVLAATLLGLLISSAAYEAVFRNQQFFNIQYARFMAADVNPSVIFLGDSRGVYGLHHADQDQNFFNYSHFGEYPYGQFLRALHAIRDKPAVKTVVIQVDAYVFMNQRSYQPLPATRGLYEYLLFSSIRDVQGIVAPTNEDLLRNVGAFAWPLSVWWERTDFWNAVQEILTSWGIDSASSLVRYLNDCGDLVTKESPLSALPVDQRMKKDRIYAENRYKYNHFDFRLAHMYFDFVRSVTERGIKVIGIRFPETTEYGRVFQSIADPAAEQFVHALGISVLDYRLLFNEVPNSDNYFTDGEHLTDQGAAILSARVAADLRKLVDLSPAEPWSCDSTKPIKARTWPFELLLKRALGLTISSNLSRVDKII